MPGHGETTTGNGCHVVGRKKRRGVSCRVAKYERRHVAFRSPTATADYLSLISVAHKDAPRLYITVTSAISRCERCFA